MPAPDAARDPADVEARADAGAARAADAAVAIGRSGATAAGDSAAAGEWDGPGDPADTRAAAARGTRRTLALAAVVAGLALAVVVGVAVSRTGSDDAAGTGGIAADRPPLLSQDGPAQLQPLPPVTLPRLGGHGPPGGVDMSETGGQPVVVNFWASWCAPCVEEMPMLQRVADDLGIRMIGVDYIDQADEAAALARQLDIRYTLVRDDDGAFGEAVGLLGTPTTLLVDGDGVVRRRLTGALTEEQLRAAIADDLGRG